MKSVIKFALTAFILCAAILAVHLTIQSFESHRQGRLPLQALLMTAISDSGGAIIEVDHSNSKIINYTPRMEAMLGYPPGFLADKTLDVLMPDWFREAHQTLMQNYQPKEAGSTAVVRCWMPHQDGSTVEVVVSVFLNKASGHLLALVIPSERVHFKDMVRVRNQTAER